MGFKRQNNKEKILKLLNDNRKGLTVKDMDKALGIGETTHIYLARLVNDDLVEWFKQENNKYKSYRLTDKYFEPERQREALKTVGMIKSLVIKGAITFDKSKMSPNEITMSEGLK